MNRPVLFVLAFLAVMPAARTGAAPLRFTATLDTTWNAGDTRYLMEIPASPYGLSSELIFPLNTLVEGLRLRWETASRRGRRWSLEGSFYTNLIDPLGLMQDFDWYMYPGYPKVPCVYTESAAVMCWYLASIETQLQLRSGGWGRFGLAFGYRFQFIKQSITGFTGWELTDVEGEINSYDPIQDSRHGLDYQVFYHTITAGLALTLTPAPAVSVTAEAGLAVPYVADRDDHVLRNKLSTASGFGYGGYAGLEARYTWTPANPRLRPFVALSGSAMGLKANTWQTQYWYGDDPTTPYPIVETGTYLYGVDHQISTRQYRVALIFGLQF